MVTTKSASSLNGLESTSKSVTTPVKASNPAKVTPLAKTKVPKKFFCFQFNNGKPDAYIEGFAEAKKFEQDYSEIIASYKSWCYKKDMINHKNKQTNTIVALVSNTSTQANVAQKIMAKMKSKEKANTFTIYYKTNGTSKLAGLVLEWKTKYGSEAWCVKIPLFQDIFQSYADVCHIADDIVRETIQNLDHTKASDPDQSDKNKVLLSKWKDNEKHIRETEVLQMYSFITIPYETLASSKEEDEWLQAKCKVICTALRDIIISNTFKEVCMMQADRENHFCHKMYDNTKYLNVPKYFKDIRLQVKECRMFTDHVIQAGSNIITTKMYDNRVSGGKYAQPKSDDTSDNQDDNSSTEQNDDEMKET